MIRNDALSVIECLELKPHAIVIGPGPGSPQQAGISKELIAHCGGKVPILGVCLGHQAIAEVHGGHVIRAERPMHGKTSLIQHDEKGVFMNMPAHFLATRYHSLIVEKQTLPPSLEISATSDDGQIMGLRHRHLLIEGVQFHPESILTEGGIQLLANFLKMSSENRSNAKVG